MNCSKASFSFFLFFPKNNCADQLVTYKNAGYSNTQNREKKVADKRNDFDGNFWWKIAMLFPSRELFFLSKPCHLFEHNEIIVDLCYAAHIFSTRIPSTILIYWGSQSSRHRQNVRTRVSSYFLHSFLSPHTSSPPFFLSSSFHCKSHIDDIDSLVQSTLNMSTQFESTHCNPVFFSRFIDSTKVCAHCAVLVFGLFWECTFMKKQTKEKIKKHIKST